MENPVLIKSFKPRPSLGWIWFALFAIVLSGLGAYVSIMMGGLNGAGIIILVVAAVLVMFLLALAIWFPGMRYELFQDKLVLRYGPVINYQIPLSEIKAIQTKNLKWTIMSALRFPGVALFGVPYGGEGEVKMCSTAAIKNVILIDTINGKYGVSPTDDKEFIAALQVRINKKT